MRDKHYPNQHSLGSEETPSATIFYRLVIRNDNSWFVLRKKDYDDGWKTPDISEISENELDAFKIDGVPLRQLVEAKLKSIGFSN